MRRLRTSLRCPDTAVGVRVSLAATASLPDTTQRPADAGREVGLDLSRTAEENQVERFLQTNHLEKRVSDDPSETGIHTLGWFWGSM